MTLLSGYFIELTRRKLGMQQLTLTSSAIDALNRYDWPGNVRELEHVIARAALRAKGSVNSVIVRIGLEHMEHLVATSSLQSASVQKGDSGPRISEEVEANLKLATEAFQRRVITQVLTEESGNWSATAKRLETDRANLNRLAKRLGIRVAKSVIADS